MNDFTCEPEAKAMRDAMEAYHKPTLQSVSAIALNSSVVPVMFAPHGMEKIDLTADLDRYLARPRRLKGTATLTSLASLIDFANRFKVPNSALFADDDRNTPGITVVTNYNVGGFSGGGDGGIPEVFAEPVAEFGDHRGKYAFPLSDEWKAWQANNGKAMTSADFASFLEDRLVDVLDPTDGAEVRNEMLAKYMAITDSKLASPQRLHAISRNLKINESSRVISAVNLQDGTGEISFALEQTVESGGEEAVAGVRMSIPNMFMIGLPVFRSGMFYRVAAHLRYRKEGGKVVFWYSLWRADIAFDDAFKHACEGAKVSTALPLFFGKPESTSTNS